MNNSVFEKTMKNVIKLVTKKNYLVSEPNYQSTQFFAETLLVIEIRKTQMFMNKPVYLNLSILELSKLVMHEYWYD